jgi:hypothetical protein
MFSVMYGSIILDPTRWKLKFAMNSSVANVFVMKVISPIFMCSDAASFASNSGFFPLSFFLSSFRLVYDAERQALQLAQILVVAFGDS